MREMKPIDCTWLDALPQEWAISRLKSVFSFGKGLPITKADLKEHGVPVISYGQIHAKFNPGTHLTKSLFRYVDDAYIGSHPSSLVHAGDIMVADTSEDLDGCGNCVYVDQDMALFAGYHTIILRAKNKENNKYLAYLFQTDAWRSQIRRQLTDVKLFSVSQKTLSALQIIVPPQNEAIEIAEFLDAKCSAIDAAISRHKAIIEKLKEYRKAVIYQAVTKGLNPSDRLVDSRSPIYGEMPEKWDLRRIKYLFSIKKEIAGEDGHTVLSITQKGIVPKDLSKNEGQIAESYANYQLVSPGDFAMNHMDLLTGWVDISKYSGVTSPDYRVFTLNDTNANDARYFLYVFQMCYTNRIFYSLGAGVSGFGRWRLQAPAFLNFAVPVPPHYDQVSIADYLDDKCTKIDKAIAHNSAAISKLENYRKSLIYYAVTGKIDCRKEDNHAG